MSDLNQKSEHLVRKRQRLMCPWPNLKETPTVVSSECWYGFGFCLFSSRHSLTAVLKQALQT